MRVWLNRTVPWPGSAAGSNSETINRAADLSQVSVLHRRNNCDARPLGAPDLLLLLLFRTTGRAIVRKRKKSAEEEESIHKIKRCLLAGSGGSDFIFYGSS